MEFFLWLTASADPQRKFYVIIESLSFLGSKDISGEILLIMYLFMVYYCSGSRNELAKGIILQVLNIGMFSYHYHYWPFQKLFHILNGVY